MAANTSARNDQAFIAAQKELAARFATARTRRPSDWDVTQSLANGVSRVGNSVGVIIGAMPAARDNFTIARESQREIQAQRSALYAMEQAEKVLRLRGM